MEKKYINCKLTDLKPWSNNPRKNEAAIPAVAESIKQCGYITPIVVDEKMEIMAGNTRYKALISLGNDDEVQVLQVTGLTKEQKRKYRLLDNKTNEFASWDFEKLEQELSDLDFGDFNFGFDLNFSSFDEDEAPEEFDEYDEEIETTNKCPKCGYEW